MKQLIAFLGLNQAEQDYFFHLMGNLAAFGFNAINEQRYKDSLEHIRTAEIIDDWASRGITYRNQDEILDHYQRYLSEARNGFSLGQYLSSQKTKRNLMAARNRIYEDRANWEHNKGFGNQASYPGKE